MFIKKIMSFLLCISSCAFGMELDTTDTRWMPYDVQAEIIRHTQDLKTILNFGETCSGYNAQVLNNLALFLCNNPAVCGSLTSNQHRFLLVKYAQQKNEYACDYLIRNENENCKNYRLRAYDFFATHCNDNDISDEISFCIKTYGGIILNRLKIPLVMCGFYAIKDFNSYVLNILLQNGLDENSTDDAGVSLLRFGCRCMDSRSVTALLRYGANVNAVSKKNKETILHDLARIVSSSEVVPIMESLLKNGIIASIDMQNRWGDTPFRVAVSCSNLYMIEKLVQRGANINLQDVNGKTALDYAHPTIRNWICSLLNQKYFREVMLSDNGDIVVTLHENERKRKRLVSVQENNEDDDKRLKRARK